MDDAILKAFEPAARIYCAKVGLDPDTLVPGESSTILGAYSSQPFWYQIARQLAELSLRLVSMKEAAEIASRMETH